MMDEPGFFNSKLPSDFATQPCERRGLPEPLREFLMRFQTECVVECCGIDAFLFRALTEEDLVWARERRIARFIESEIDDAEEIATEIVGVWELNQLFIKAEWISLLKHLIDLIEE